MRIAVIGGGAAGFFAAISCAAKYPEAKVTLFERTDRPLAKVRISGGGRCNVTTSITSPADMIPNYPRGGRALKPLFHQFGPIDTVKWFNDRAVELKTEADGRVFPVTDDSQTIIECLVHELLRLRVSLRTDARVEALQSGKDAFVLRVNGMDDVFSKVIIATGGSPKAEGLGWLAELGHIIEQPVPSLFTFNLKDDPIIALQGLSVPEAIVRLSGTDLSATGPVLVTHWGLSGPAVLRLSAFGARWLAEHDYRAEVMVNWVGLGNEEAVRLALNTFKTAHSKALVKGNNPFRLPIRLWEHLCIVIGLCPTLLYSELGGKTFNRLVNLLMNDAHTISGKTTFKEEFVTCGGISLKSVDMRTMQSRSVPGLYFAGEVLDIDGVTGGFNFQAAWTTGFVAGQLGN